MSEKFFDFFDKAYCINLKKRPDRLEHIKKEIEKYDLGDIFFFEAIDGDSINNTDFNKNLKNGEIGLILSVLEIIKDCKRNNYKNVIIIEDDCVFSPEINKHKLYLDNLPNDWDMFYLGGNHNTHEGTSPPISVNDYYTKLHRTYTTHFVAIKNTVFDHIEAILEKFKEPLDVSYVRIQNIFNVYCTKKTIATQKEGYSDILLYNVNYDSLIR